MPPTLRPLSPAPRPTTWPARALRAAVALALLVLGQGGPTRAHAAPSTPPPLPVLVFAGQSNMVGWLSSVDDLTSAQKQTQPNVLFFGPNETGSTWGGLMPPTVYMTNGVGFNKGFGPEISTGLVLTQLPGFGLVAEVKYAETGTDLDYWWDPDEPNRTYDRMMDRVDNALAALALAYSDRTVYVAGFFWMQGEADAVNFPDGIALAYEANLTHFIERVRADFGDPDLPFVLGQILGGHHEAGIVRAAQASVAAQVPNVRLVLTDDLPHETRQGLHFTSAGIYTLGERFGTAFAVLAILTQRVYLPVVSQ